MPIPFKFDSCTIFTTNLKAVNIFNRSGVENVFKNSLHLFFINIFYFNYKTIQKSKHLACVIYHDYHV